MTDMNAMKRVITGGLLFLLAGSLIRARELSSYRETVYLNPDGSADIHISLTVCAGSDPQILISVPRTPLLELKVRGIDSSAVRTIENQGSRFVALQLPGTSQGVLPVDLAFRVASYFEAGAPPAPFGKQALAYRFVNVGVERIKAFSAQIALPVGQVFFSIDDFSPKPGNTGMTAPYVISRVKGRNVVTISLSDVKLGDEIVLRGSFRSAAKSKVMLYFLAGLAVVYLVFFRDVLKNREKASVGKA
jgi:hypothetical protein